MVFGGVKALAQPPSVGPEPQDVGSQRPSGGPSTAVQRLGNPLTGRRRALSEVTSKKWLCFFPRQPSGGGGGGQSWFAVSSPGLS